MARKIVITSGKGGVGKTTVAVQLAARLARKGQRVILCDADFGLNNVDVCAGVEGLVTYDVVDVIEGRCRAKQALVRHPKNPNLYILTSNNATSERYVSPQAVKVVLDALSPQFDFIFIDCPAGVDEGFHRAVGAAEEAIVVTTPSISAVRDADRALTLLKSYRLQSIYLIVNMVKGELLAAGECISPQQISELLKLQLIGVVPEENSIVESDLSSSHVTFRLIAYNLLTGKQRLYDAERKYCGIFGNVRRALKKAL